MALFKDKYELCYYPTRQINLDTDVIRPFLEVCKRNGCALKEEPHISNLGWYGAGFKFSSGDSGSIIFDLELSFGKICIERKKHPA